jgi:hypothetical protein
MFRTPYQNTGQNQNMTNAYKSLDLNGKVQTSEEQTVTNYIHYKNNCRLKSRIYNAVLGLLIIQSAVENISTQAR